MDSTAWLDRHHYGYLADLTVALHLGYVGTVVFGLVFILVGASLGWRASRNGWFRLTHLVMIWIVAIEAVLHITCPLTTLEQKLRGWADQRVSERTFVGRMMDRLLFVDYHEPEEAPPAEPAPPEPIPEPIPEPVPSSVPASSGPIAPLPAVTPPPPIPEAPPAPVEPVRPASPVPPAHPLTAIAPPREVDMTVVYVVFAVFTSILYLTYPPLETKSPSLPG